MREKEFDLLLPDALFPRVLSIVLCAEFQQAFLGDFPVEKPNHSIIVNEWEQSESKDDDAAQKLTRTITLSTPLDFAPAVLLDLIGVEKSGRTFLSQVS